MQTQMQKTLKRSTSLSGVALHTGKFVNLKFNPAPVNTGIVFIRIDLPTRPKIPANIANVIDLARRPRRTSIGAEQNIEIHTVEHLMASLYGLGIDNLIIEIDGEEVPGLDGSAAPFIETFKEAGIEELSEPKQYFTIREPIWIEEGQSSISILPAEEFRISYTLSYQHSFLKDQFLDIVVTPENFANLVAPSRTFCLDEEVKALRSLGLGKGANYENTLVVGSKGVIRNRTRFESEFVQHKVLDLIGDLYLLGHPIKGHVVAIKSGHPLNVKLLQKIKRQQEKFHAASIPSVHYEPGAGPFDVEAIKRILPHRFPFLLVDRVLHIEEDKRAVGIKNVTANDYFFMGHFPDRAVMPGVLIVEALAQLAGVLLLNKRENLGKYAFFMSIDKVKFRKPIVPGDQVTLEIAIDKVRSRTAQVTGKAYVDGKVVTEAEFMFSVVDP